MTDARVYFDLNSALKKRDMTKTQLSKLTGIRPSTISDITKRGALNLTHTATICKALKITDIRELVKLEYTD